MKKKIQKRLALTNGKNITSESAFFRELDREAFRQFEERAWEFLEILNSIGDLTLTAAQSNALIEAEIM